MMLKKRQERLEAQRKAAADGMAVSRPKTRLDKEKLKENQKKEAHRLASQKYRNKMTPQKRRRVNEKRMARYYLQKEQNLADVVRCTEKTLHVKQAVPESSCPYPTEGAFRKAVQLVRQRLRARGAKLAHLLKGVIKSSDCETRDALRELNVTCITPEKDPEVVDILKSHIHSTKRKMDKNTLRHRRSLANTFQNCHRDMRAITVQTKYISSVLLLIWIGIVFIALPLNGDHNVNGDEDLDPYDMVNFDHVSMKMKKKSPPAVKSKPEEEQPLCTEELGKDGSAAGKEGSKTTSAQQEDRAPTIKKPEEKDQTPVVNKPPPSPQAMVPECPKSKESCPALYLFQRFVSDLLKLIRNKVSQVDEKTELCLRLSLTPQQIEMLENFKEDHSKDRVFSAQEILTKALQGASVFRSDDLSIHSLWFEEQFGIPVEKAVQVLFFIVLLVAFSLLLSKLRFSVNLVCWFAFIGFLLSVFTTWLRLYKGEVAKQHEAMMKNPPSGCTKLPESDSQIENILNVFKYYFTFQQDACVEYYEHLFVDPIVKFSLKEALAVAVVQTFLKPMRTIGTELSLFIRALLKDLPAQWQLFTIVSVFIFVALLLFLSCGYRMRIPFLLAIEPAPRPDDGHNEGEVRALRQEISHLQAQVESIGGGSGPRATQPPALPQASNSAPALPQSSHKDTTCPQPQSIQEKDTLLPGIPCSAPIPESQTDTVTPSSVESLPVSSSSQGSQGERLHSEEHNCGSDSMTAQHLSSPNYETVPQQNQTTQKKEMY